ncbi:hypothetical protein SDC9_14983 [bioreactor metagenome]|uniref:Uncharacterized protein n=1 Tax=bioreactor metagenome TaxID=1076179 RepID=A0A644TRY6_9ZZZZ|nr:hypothetical protein [Negativicutes bacterium]
MGKMIENLLAFIVIVIVSTCEIADMIIKFFHDRLRAVAFWFNKA